MSTNESARVKQVYQARREKDWGQRYSWYQRGTLQAFQERQRILLSMLRETIGSLEDKRILDIGCGYGNTLIPFLLYGVKVENCFGVDILEDRIEAAKKRLPGMTFICCSGESIPFEKGTFNLVTMFTCLSSVLDKNIRYVICQEALSMLRPGGWVLIYDFRVNNPWNPDVKAVTWHDLKDYFQGCSYHTKTLTLVPQLHRAIGPYLPWLCGMLALVPFLRTHRMTMFQKGV